MNQPSLTLEDIQGTVLRRRPNIYFGAYLLYKITNVDNAREMLKRVLPDVTSAQEWGAPRPFTLNVVFSWQGLKVLGLSDTSLESFPDEFRAGMAARSEVLGDQDGSAPENWVRPFGESDAHIGIVISSTTESELELALKKATLAHEGLIGIDPIYRLDVGVPSTGREHFGFRDGIGSVSVIGSGLAPLPGQDEIMPGEFVFGYPDETAKVGPMPQPETLGRNGSLMAFRQMHCDVAAFRRYLHENARSEHDEELLAAKMIGRWRSGAPLALSPDHDDPELAADPQRNNDFLYYEDDPHGLKCPRSSHIRRCNPRDSLKESVVNVNRHRLIRRGAAYGPVLPEGQMTDDGVERGIVFIFMGASLARQFEFIQHVWINDGEFVGEGNEMDPLIGDHKRNSNYTIPARPVRRRMTGLPRFVTVRGGEYFFLPGLTALEWLAEGKY
jgi:Dyp-type peroxidase family